MLMFDGRRRAEHGCPRGQRRWSRGSRRLAREDAQLPGCIARKVLGPRGRTCREPCGGRSRCRPRRRRHEPCVRGRLCCSKCCRVFSLNGSQPNGCCWERALAARHDRHGASSASPADPPSHALIARQAFLGPACSWNVCVSPPPHHRDGPACFGWSHTCGCSETLGGDDAWALQYTNAGGEHGGFRCASPSECLWRA